MTTREKPDITTEVITKLIEAVGGYPQLAVRMEVSETSIRRWEKNTDDGISAANRRELGRLARQYKLLGQDDE